MLYQWCGIDTSLTLSIIKDKDDRNNISPLINAMIDQRHLTVVVSVVLVAPLAVWSELAIALALERA